MTTTDWPEGGIDSMRSYDGNEDARRSYDVYAAAKREMLVRAGLVHPQNETELRQAAEGPVPVPKLEAGRK